MMLMMMMMVMMLMAMMLMTMMSDVFHVKNPVAQRVAGVVVYQQLYLGWGPHLKVHSKFINLLSQPSGGTNPHFALPHTKFNSTLTPIPSHTSIVLTVMDR
jgi:hypothetical protein